MKITFLLFCLAIYSCAAGQSLPLKEGKNWKLYDISDENAFQYRLDTLLNFSNVMLSADTMRSFTNDIAAISSKGPQVWMGAYIATYEIGTNTYKVEISHYGGILYDESTKKHYQVAEKKIQYWQSFIRQKFLEFRDK